MLLPKLCAVGESIQWAVLARRVGTPEHYERVLEL